MKNRDAFIDWSTTKIAALGERQQTLVLMVKVGGFASRHWKDAFGRVIKAYNRRQKSWGNVGLSSSGPMGDTRIRVDDIKPGDEADLKAQLDHLAKLPARRHLPRMNKMSGAALRKKQRRTRLQRWSGASVMPDADNS